MIRRLSLLALLLASFGLATATSASAEKYVAMGDSYSAGTGTNNYDWTSDGACQRSTQAYAPLIRGSLGAQNSFKFAACSGAVVNQITTNTQGGNPAPQALMLNGDELDITISIGGNDAGFGDVLLKCGYPMVSCDGDLDTAQAFITDTLPGRLNTAYNLIRQKAPNARVGVVSYPRLFPASGDDCSAATFFSAGEITRMNQMADLLADVSRTRARAHGFSFIDARPAFMGHAWCENEWINGLSNPTSNSFHPNVAGYQGYSGIVRGAMLAAPTPDFSRGANGRIAFESTRDGNSEIYVINGNGSFPVNLTMNPADDRVPSFSPDGTKVVFSSNRHGNYELYTMNSTGGSPTRLTTNAASDFDPSWSPNGKQIIFRSDRDGDNEIFKINANGSNLWDGNPVHQLTHNTASDFAPGFSPDGAEIAFQRYTAGTGNGQGNEVFKMNADGQGQVNLTNNAAATNDGAPQWSPDGSQIAFQSNRIASDNFEIYTMPTTGGTATRRTSVAGNDMNPTWAPSGSHIAFRSDRTGAKQIYTMTPTGSSQTRRTTGSADDQVPSWQGDAKPPQTTIDSAPAPVSNNQIATFTFSADEAGSTFECKLDGSAFQACSSPYSSVSLADGTHNFAVRATDPSGNLDGAPAVRNFVIDTAAKVSEITAGPSGSTKVAEPVFEFSADDVSVTFECRLDPPAGPETGWQSCVSPFQTGTLADGDHRFEVRGTDGVGNIEPEPQVRQFTVDTLAPETVITYAPAALGTDAAPLVEFASDPGSRFECRLSADSAGGPGEWLACESPHRIGQLADDKYNLEVRATDPAGNLEPEAAHAVFTIDTQAPVTTIDSAPGPDDETTSVTFGFTADDADATFECRLDGLDEADWTACTSPATYDDVNHGRHNFQVRGIDEAGNTEAEPASSDFGVRNDPAYLITLKPDLLSNDSEPAFEFTSKDPDASYECRLDSDLESAWEPCLGSFVIPHKDYVPETGEELPLPDQIHDGQLTDGVHQFELRATDWFGEVTTLPVYEWTVVTGPPVAKILSKPRELTNAGTASFIIDPGFGANRLECRIDGSAWTVCGSDPLAAGEQSVEYSGLFDQVHSFAVRARGPLFTDPGPPAEWHWNIDSAPPRANITRGPGRYTRSTSASFEFSATDPVPGSGVTGFRCRTGANAFTGCQSPVNLSGLAEGDHRFEVVALDSAGNASPVSDHLWSVDLTGPVVELIQAPPASTEDASARFVFGTNEPGAVFSCGLDGEAPSTCTSPVNLAALAIGQQSFEIRATDSLGNVGAMVKHLWTVIPVKGPAPAPSIRFIKKLKLKPNGATRVATAVCPAGSTCRLAAPKKATLRVGSKAFRIKVKAPRQIAAGRAGAVSVIVPKPVRRALGNRTGKLNLKLTITTGDGQRKTAGMTIKLRQK